MKNTLSAFLIAAFFACCIGCGSSGPTGEGYQFVTEYGQYLEGKAQKNQQMQIEALEKIIANDPNAVDPDGQPIKVLLDFAKEGKING